jgi:formylglycine-generating enzyme required for sulfatase activity
MANYKDSGDPYETGDYPWTTPVGYYKGNQVPSGVDMANGYGLYDIIGIVNEWCNDWYDDSYYQDCVNQGMYDNPKGPPYGPDAYRVRRGGTWLLEVFSQRSANRSFNFPDLRVQSAGIRLALKD